MKAYEIRKEMFIDWSDEDLKSAIDTICVKFGLSVHMVRREHLVDWNKTDKPDAWSFSLHLAHETDDYETTVMARDYDRYEPVRAYCQNHGQGYDFEGDKHEMMRSLLAAMCGSTLFVDSKIDDLVQISLPKPVSGPNHLAHIPGSYSAGFSFTDDNAIMLPQKVKVPICTVPEFSSFEELKLKLEIVE